MCLNCGLSGCCQIGIGSLHWVKDCIDLCENSAGDAVDGTIDGSAICEGSHIHIFELRVDVGI